MSGVLLEVVQKMLRHTDPKITASGYGHLLMKYQRDAIAKALLVPSEILSGKPGELRGAAPGASNDPLLLVPTGPRCEGRAGTGGKKPLSVPALGMERETGFGPATLSLGKGRAGLAPARTEPQARVTTAPGYDGLPHPAHGAATDFPKFGTTLGTSPRKLDIRAGILLTARDVALRLRVSTATVYALCRRGELGHHRVSNAIRVSEDALAIYLHGR